MLSFAAISNGLDSGTTKSYFWWTHLQKMLYDNAHLMPVYQVTGNEFHKRVMTEILDDVASEEI